MMNPSRFSPLRPSASSRWARFYVSASLSIVSGLLTSCDEAPSVEEAKAKARQVADQAVEVAYKAKDTALSAKDWVAKHQPEIMAKFSGLRAQWSSLQAKLEAQDFSEARKLGDEIDKLLGSRSIGQSIEFLRIGTLDGADKAKSAIRDFSALHPISDTEKKAFAEVERYFDKYVGKGNVPQLVGWIVYMSLTDKIGRERADIPAAIATDWTAEIMGVNVAKNPFSHDSASGGPAGGK